MEGGELPTNLPSGIVADGDSLSAYNGATTNANSNFSTSTSATSNTLPSIKHSSGTTSHISTTPTTKRPQIANLLGRQNRASTSERLPSSKDATSPATSYTPSSIGETTTPTLFDSPPALFVSPLTTDTTQPPSSVTTMVQSSSTLQTPVTGPTLSASTRQSGRRICFCCVHFS